MTISTRRPSPTATNTITPEANTVELLGVRTPTPLNPTEAPTLDVTPTFVTAAPETLPAPVTPQIVFASPAPATTTLLPPLATEATLTATPLPTIVLIPAPTSSTPLTLAFALDATGGAVTGSGFLLPFSATTFARNPVDPSRMAVVDSRGLLYMFFGGLAVENGVRVRVSPFAEPEPLSEETNNASVVQVAWSPDGRYLAFLVDTERDSAPGNDSLNDGVWLLDTQQPDQIGGIRLLFRECPPIVSVCAVNRGGGPFRYNSLHFDWNNGSSALLIRLDLPDEGRRGFTVVSLGNDPAQLAPTYRYDYAAWSWDGTRILASGSGADGRVALRWLDPTSGVETLILDGSARGLWLQDAVERPNGTIVALGSTSGANSAMRLYDASGTPISAPIGTAAPERVAWSPDRSAVLVVVNESGTRRYYLAQVGGDMREITESVAGALAVEWVGAAPTPAVPTATPAPPLVQSQYGLHVNAQAQVSAPVGVNLRAAPSTDAAVLQLLNAFEYVLIMDGPVQANGLIWWKVQSGSGLVGWAAESVNGVQLLSLTPR